VSVTQRRESAPLHVVHVIDSLAPGGAEVSLTTLAPALVHRGVRLDVVALKATPGLQPALGDAGVVVTELSGSRRTWWRQLQVLLRERHPALVHTTLFEADLAGRIGARLSHVPVVSTLANESYGTAHRAEYGSRPLRLLAAQFSDAATARFTVRLHAISCQVADVMAQRLLYPRDRIDVILRGRDPDILGRRTLDRRRRVRERLGVLADEPLLLVLARQERQKGLDLLIDALPRVLAQVPKARLFIAGRTGNETASLRAQVARVDQAGRVDFLGVRSDTSDLLCAADAFVLPSRREGLGSSVLEAMALECPIVVSDLPAVREMVDDALAVLVPPEDPDALAAAVLHTLSSRHQSRERANAARRRFLDRFTVDRIADQTVCFYERCIAASHT